MLDKTLLTADLIGYVFGGDDLYLTQSTFAKRMNWWYHVRNGDSGSGVFHVINNQLVLLGNWLWLQGGTPIIAENIALINYVIGKQHSLHQLEEVGLSGFTTY